MATDWAADVKKYVPDADDAIIAGIVRYCGIALRNRDSSLVAFSDPKELDRVRNNFLKKKLALTHADDALNAAIAVVGDKMKADRTKNRVTVYYLLAESFDTLAVFAKKTATTKAATVDKADAKPKKAVSTKKAAAGAALGVASLADIPKKAAGTAKKVAKPVASTAKAAVSETAGVISSAASAGADAVKGVAGTVADTAGAAGARAVDTAATVTGAAGAAVAGAAGLASGALGKATSTASGAAQQLAGSANDDDERSGLGWLWWLLLALLLLFAIWWLFFRQPAADTATPTGTETAAAAAAAAGVAGAPSAAPVDLTAAPAEGTVTIPAGAGVTAETRDGKPVVKVYFDTGKADVVPVFTDTAGGLKAWLESHAGSSIAVSGYNDASGNAAVNAEMSKNRAKAVKAALVAAGIADASVELVKPENTTDTSVAADAARRVEVSVR